jgi:hypothetical protein
VENIAQGLCADQRRPSLLVSFFYLKQFQDNRSRYHFRDWVMDSGAFSAKNSGSHIDLDEYIATCKELLASDPQLTEVFSLDVIGDYLGTAANTDKMWAAGLEAIPTFHVGTPWGELERLAREYPKIALGGAVGMHQKAKAAWVGQCFARVWPKRIHGFGMSGVDMLMSFPFESVDATSWELGPCAFGQWKTLGKVSVRNTKARNLRGEVLWYLDLEAKAAARWRRELDKLGSERLSLRLAIAGHRTPGEDA